MSDLKALSEQGYEAFAKADMATLTKLINEKCVWHVDGDNAISGDYEGREAIFGFFANLAEQTQGSLKIEPKAIRVLNDQLVQVITVASAKKGDKSISDYVEAHLSRWENGEIVEFWGTFIDAAVSDDFWGPKA